MFLFFVKKSKNRKINYFLLADDLKDEVEWGCPICGASALFYDHHPIFAC